MAGRQEEKRRYKVGMSKYNLEPTRTGTDWNPYQLYLPLTLMMWASCLKKPGPFVTELNTHVVQESKNLKEDPRKGGCYPVPMR